MDQPAEPRRHCRLLIAAIAGGVALLVAVGVGIYGLVRGPGDTRRDPASSGTVATSPATRSTTPTGTVRLPATGDAEAFARAVAEALFTWDTLSGATTSDYAQVLSDAADDSEADALASDVRAYLPAAEAWAQLTTYQTRQWLTIDTATVPQAWTTAQAQAAPGQLPQGATAYTITGTRHRAGIWNTEPVQASRPVSFTVFLVCAPPAPEFRIGLCRLLRLSELDYPLH